MTNIKIILWDIDGTILNFHEAEKNAIRKCFEIFGLGECTDSMLAEYSLINKKYWEMLERNEITKPQVLEGRFKEFFTNHQLDISCISAFNKEYQIRLGDTICFNDNAFQIISDLKGKVRQYAVTNGTKSAQKNKLSKSGLDKILDGVFISDEIGIEKPMKGFFDAVFAEIGNAQKEEVLIVGDSLTSDILGGNNAGILCCWYNPTNKKADVNYRIDYEIDSLNKIYDILDFSI